MLCVLIFYVSGGTYSLKSTPKDKFFEKLFMAILFTRESFCQKSAERKSPKKYLSYFVLMSGLGLLLHSHKIFYAFFMLPTYRTTLQCCATNARIKLFSGKQNKTDSLVSDIVVVSVVPLLPCTGTGTGTVSCYFDLNAWINWNIRFELDWICCYSFM